MNEHIFIVNTCLRKTVLIVLTSFSSNFSDICLPCLERSVDIAAFKKVYILANCVTPEHAATLKRYEQKFNNLQCIFYEPKGLRFVTSMFEIILEMHRSDIILKIDDDVFVAKNCINNLVETYYRTIHDNSISMVTPLIWNNGACLDIMKSYLAEKYPHAVGMDVLNPTKGLSNLDTDGCDFLWSRELSDKIMTAYSSKAKDRICYTNHPLSINCIMFDNRAMDKVLPFQDIDEVSFNRTIIGHGMRFAVDTSALAYHYSFGPLKEFMLTKYPLRQIKSHVLSL